MLVGQQAPDFTLDGVVGRGDFKKISLTEFRGKWLVLFFYPLDFTVVCPTEILEFSRREADFKLETLHDFRMRCLPVLRKPFL